MNAIIEALRRLVPSEAPSPGTYIERNVPGARSWDLSDRLRVLLAAGQSPRFLLHGALGVGKSTELMALQVELRDVAQVHLLRVLPGNAPLTAFQGAMDQALASLPGRPPSMPPGRYAQQLRHQGGAPVLLLVDGLDLCDEATARSIFGPGSPLNGADMPAAVFVAPHMLLRWSRQERGFDDVVHLPPFAVVDDKGTPNIVVLEQFVRGLRARLAGCDAVESDDLLRQIALASGGVPRDAIRLLRGTLLAAIRTGTANAAHVGAAERELRQDLEQALRPSDDDSLLEVYESGEFRGDASLLIRGAILLYEDADGERYWRVHPLLAPYLKRRHAEARRRAVAALEFP